MRNPKSLLAICLLAVLPVGSIAEAQPVRKVLQKCFGLNCQQQQAVDGQAVVVNQYDPIDGALIVSVGPSVDLLPSMVIPSVAPALPEASIMSARRDFRQSFLVAVKQARDAGDITAFQHGRLVVASLRPRELANIQAWVHENAIQEGLATTQAPDWSAIISFIKELIPLIIQLIDLFSFNTTSHIEAQYALRNNLEPQIFCDWSGLAA